MVEQPQKRQSRYTDKELFLIKNTFAENYGLIKAVRKVLIQQPLTVVEEQMIKSTIVGDVAKLLKKIFVPELDGDVSLTNLADKYYVNTDDRPLDAVYFDISVNELLYKYIECQLAILSGKHSEKELDIDDLIKKEGLDKEQVCINFGARAKILNHIESILQAIMIIAGAKKETAEEMKKRMGMDSAK